MYVVADGASDADSKVRMEDTGLLWTLALQPLQCSWIPTDHRYLYGNQPAENIRCRCDPPDRCFESWEKRSTEADDPKSIGIRELIEQVSVPVEQVIIAAIRNKIVLLMGYSCETLGCTHFTPVNIQTIETTQGKS